MEQSTFESLASQAGNTAYSAAMAVLADGADAADVAQDVMLKLWTMHARIADKAGMMRLARVMGRRVAIDLWRRNRTRQSGELKDMTTDMAPSPQEEMEGHEADLWLVRRMESLPPAEYQILRMRQVEELSNTEIAHLLNIKPQSVATLLSRARHKLFEQIKRNR